MGAKGAQAYGQLVDVGTGQNPIKSGLDANPIFGVVDSATLDELVALGLYGYVAAGSYADRLNRGYGVRDRIDNGLTDDDKAKIDHWKYKPSESQYLQYKDIFDDPKYYNQDTGEIQWPENDGFQGPSQKTVLEPGMIIDRYGSGDGIYVSPYGTPYSERSLPPGSRMREYNVYEVISPIVVDGGEIAPWFGEPGGGTQYIMPDQLDELVKEGILRKVD